MKAHFRYWQMAYLKGALVFFGGFQLVMQTSAANINYTSLDRFSAFLLWLGAIGGGAAALLGFLDKTMANLSAGKDNPAGVGNTEHITKP